MIRAQVLLCGIEDVLSFPKVRANLAPSTHVVAGDWCS